MSERRRAAIGSWPWHRNNRGDTARRAERPTALARIGTALLSAAFVAAASAEPSFALDDAVSASADQILDCGFRKRFDREIAEIIEVETKKDDRIVRRFRLQMASKLVDGAYRSLVYFLEPPDERGMRVLTLERETRRDEHFVFLPFLDRVKRIYGGRRAESFLGTDFSFEDMERVRVEELESELRGVEVVDGERVYVIATRPLFPSGYVRSEYRVAESDCNILEMRHFKRNRDTPFKVITVPRSRMRRVDGELVPTWAVARNLEAGSETRLRFSEIHLDPGLDATQFSQAMLLRMNGIPGLPKNEPTRDQDAEESPRSPSQDAIEP